MFYFNRCALDKLEALKTPASWWAPIEKGRLKPITVGWGELEMAVQLQMECGYFHNAAWIDKRGMYLMSSLRDPSLRKVLEHYTPPIDIINAILELPSSQVSKYAQPIDVPDWKGVVLMGQSLMDNSVSCMGIDHYNMSHGITQYMHWYRTMCDQYGKDLYVKIHPFVAQIKPYMHMLQEVAWEYGATAESCSMDIINHCEKVVLYNSTAIVDCWMRGVPVEQYAGGTFDTIPAELGKQMVHFLMWQYCIPLNLTGLDLHKTLEHYTQNDVLWPLPPELSWGQWAVTNLLSKET